MKVNPLRKAVEQAIEKIGGGAPPITTSRGKRYANVPIEPAYKISAAAAPPSGGVSYFIWATDSWANPAKHWGVS
jgi:hypothetical protein